MTAVGRGYSFVGTSQCMPARMHLLIKDERGVLMAAMGERHVEAPGRPDLPGLGVDPFAGGREVELGFSPGGDFNAEEGFWFDWLGMAHSAARRRVTPQESVILLQQLAGISGIRRWPSSPPRLCVASRALPVPLGREGSTG